MLNDGTISQAKLQDSSRDQLMNRPNYIILSAILVAAATLLSDSTAPPIQNTGLNAQHI